MTIRIFVQSEHLPDIALVKIAKTATVDELRRACLQLLPEHLRTGDFILFEEDQDNALASDRVLNIETGHSIHVHLSRCEHVDVTVRYAGRNIAKKFRPSTTIERIKTWAAHELGIAEHDADELVLQLAGTDVQPDKNRHIGNYAKCPDCSVVLDLVAVYRVNGEAGAAKTDQDQLLSHLDSPRFLGGVDRGRWQAAKIDWPYAFVSIHARDGHDFLLRLECSGYPRTAPTGVFWDLDRNAPLAAHKWPKAGARVGQALRTDWQGGTALYIPCDRAGIAGHDQWVSLYPAWLWEPAVGLSKYLEVVHDLLNGTDYVGPAA
jgi:hypothetical protein